MMSERLEQLAVAWCRLMHSEISRPVHGRYQCLTCKRYYPVPWEHESNPAPKAVTRLSKPGSDTVKPAHAA
jgi:hypothetical protein